MTAMITFLTILALSFLAVRIGTVALIMTGFSARRQAVVEQQAVSRRQEEKLED